MNYSKPRTGLTGLILHDIQDSAIRGAILCQQNLRNMELKR